MQLHLCTISQQCQKRQLKLTDNSFAKPQTEAENKCCVCSLSGPFGPPQRHWRHFSMSLIYAFSFCCSRIPTMYSAVFSWCWQCSKHQLGRKMLFLPGTYHCAFLASYSRAEFLQHHWFPLRATHPHLIPGLLKLIFLFSFLSSLLFSFLSSFPFPLYFPLSFPYNFFFEFSFFLNWPPSKRDWYLQWAWPYCFMFQIHQLSTPCNPQLPSDLLPEKKKRKK